MTESAPPFDLVTMGRIGVDLCPLRSGAPLTLVQTFGEFLGGSAADVAVAGARPGRSSAVVTRTGADAFDDHPHQALREFGVDDRGCRPCKGRSSAGRCSTRLRAVWGQPWTRRWDCCEPRQQGYGRDPGHHRTRCEQE